MMRVLIGVPAWNEEAGIAATIESLLALDYPHTQIVVVDDASTDATPDIVRAYAGQGVELLRAPTNQGSKSQALRLIPLERYNADIFVCVDADTTLAPNALSELVKAFDVPGIAVACGQVNARLDPTRMDGNFWLSGRSAEYVTGQRICKEAQAKWNSVLIASGCMFAVRMDFMMQHGFSERTMAEDMDLTWTAVEHGFDIAYVPAAQCYVNDPYNWHTYRSQVSRWYRGYFQNIKVRRGNLFRRPKLGVIAYMYLGLNLTGLPLFLLTLVTYTVPTIVSTLINLTILTAYYHPWKHPVHSVKGIVKMILLSAVNYSIFMHALWQEIVIGKPLKVWVKGH